MQYIYDKLAGSLTLEIKDENYNFNADAHFAANVFSGKKTSKYRSNGKLHNKKQSILFPDGPK